MIINTLLLASAIAIEDTGINPFGDIYNRHCFSWITVSMHIQPVDWHVFKIIIVLVCFHHVV